MIERVRYTCPVCGYPELSTRPYENFPDLLPIPDTVTPPYEDHFGGASYEVCPCCGFEFGFDDHPGASGGESFAQYRMQWLRTGWWSPQGPPENWNAREQLARARIPEPL